MAYVSNGARRRIASVLAATAAGAALETSNVSADDTGDGCGSFLPPAGCAITGSHGSRRLHVSHQDVLRRCGVLNSACSGRCGWAGSPRCSVRPLCGSVTVAGKVYTNPSPSTLLWRPDRLTVRYEIEPAVVLEEVKFFTNDDARNGLPGGGC